jgi:rhodanese-related sulfurtransferase
VVVSNLLLVSPEQAQSLLEQGYTYVDVRSEPEFAVGRPAGAINVPLLTVEGDRLVDNPEFVHVMQAVFRTTDPLVIGCRSGGRSHIAVQRLAALGFETLRELRYGFEGARDDFGRRLPGWRHSGLPVETGESERASYAAVRATHHRSRLG